MIKETRIGEVFELPDGQVVRLYSVGSDQTDPLIGKFIVENVDKNTPIDFRIEYKYKESVQKLED